MTCPEKTSLLETLPDGLAERGFYEPNDMGFEKNIRERMAYWQKLKDKMAQAADRGTGRGPRIRNRPKCGFAARPALILPAEPRRDGGGIFLRS